MPLSISARNARQLLDMRRAASPDLFLILRGQALHFGNGLLKRLDHDTSYSKSLNAEQRRPRRQTATCRATYSALKFVATPLMPVAQMRRRRAVVEERGPRWLPQRLPMRPRCGCMPQEAVGRGLDRTRAPDR